MFSPAEMSANGSRFAALYVALEQHVGDGVLWRVKPKLHLFMHLIESLDSPAVAWTYRDEDFGGTAAALVRSKGGRDTPRAAGVLLLEKFMGRHEFPVIC